MHGYQMPDEKRFNPHFEYFARARGYPRPTSSVPEGDINSLGLWGYFSPHRSSAGYTSLSPTSSARPTPRSRNRTTCG